MEVNSISTWPKEPNSLSDILGDVILSSEYRNIETNWFVNFNFRPKEGKFVIYQSKLDEQNGDTVVFSLEEVQSLLIGINKMIKDYNLYLRSK
jgi:hypothetical protein